MDKIFEALNHYDIVTCLIPGMVFCQLTDWIYGTRLIEGNSITLMIISYVLGIVVGRIGSVIIEPICEDTKIIVKADYERWRKAASQCEEVKTLTTKSTVYRSWIALMLIQIILLFIFPLSAFAADIGRCNLFFGQFIVFVLLILSYRKQIDYVRKRVDGVMSDITD